jgi:SAM-dependent methyltransferase
VGSPEPPHRAREGVGLSERSAADLWGLADDYERLAQRFASVHDELVARLEPGPGVRWLDVATGTGEVARRAGEAGAEVTGIDIAPAMIETARAKVPTASFDVGDAQALPYENASFDVVSSSFGLIFAPDQEAVARELARVTRDRVGITAWEPNPDLAELFKRFGVDSPEGRAAFEWGTRARVQQLLAPAFELEIERRAWILEGIDGEELWRLWSTSAPPFRAMVDDLGDRREEFHEAYVEYCERFRVGQKVRVPRTYLIVVGKKK